MIIDFHTHAFPDTIAHKAIPIMAQKAGVPARADGTISGLTHAARRAEVDICVLQPVATRPGQSPSINEWTVSVLSDTIMAFGSIHPEDTDIEDTISYLQDYGVRGVKLHPDYQDFMADDPSVFSLYEALFRRDMAVLFHAGVDIGLPDPVHCTPAMLARVTGYFPEATVIAAHFGGYQCWDEVEDCLIGTPLYLDTAYTVPELPAERLAALSRKHGIDKIVFGTDSPWRDMGKETAAISEAGFSPDELEKIFWKNAAGLLGVPIEGKT